MSIVERKTVLSFLLTPLLGLQIACSDGGTDEEPAASPPAPEAAESRPTPEIFAAGTVSTPAPEFATSLTADGGTVYFNRASEDRSELILLTARKLEDGTWTTPENVPFSDGVYRDIDPFVSEDGSRLFFSSNRPTPGESDAGDFDLWVVDRAAEGSWGEPRNLGASVNTDATEIYSTLSRNGNLYFSSDRDGESFIYRSRFVDGRFGEAERLLLGTEEESAGGNPAIAPDESFLIFTTVREDGVGGSDLYVSLRRDDAWTSPRLLDEPINSTFTDFAPHIAWDGDVLYWTSERPGIVAADVVEGRPPGDLYFMPWSP